jgi:hypothetical protein
LGLERSIKLDRQMFGRILDVREAHSHLKE